MANPIVAILSIAGVIGGGAVVAATNHHTVQPPAQDPVVTVEGEPVIVGSGFTAKAPTPVVQQAPKTTTPVVNNVSVSVTAPVASNTVAVPVAPPAAPPVSTHTGGSAVAGGENEYEYEDEDEQEVENEYEDERED